MKTKKTWLKMTGLSALCAVAATSAQAVVISFTDGSIANGNLSNNVDWTGGGAGNYVVTSGTGLVVSDTAGNNRVTYLPAIIADEMTIGATFRFSETADAVSTAFQTVLEISLRGNRNDSGTEDINLTFNRKNGTNLGNYQFGLSRGTDAVPTGATHSSLFLDSTLGLNFAGGDADSDLLFLTFTTTKGATAVDTWATTGRLFNLTTDPTMNSAIATLNLAVNPNDGLFTSDLTAGLNSRLANNLAGVTGLTLESFTVIPEPSAALLGGLGLLALLRRRR